MGDPTTFEAARMAIHLENAAALEKALMAADIAARDVITGGTLLHIAATSSDSPELIRVLVARGAHLEAVDDAGRTPLYAAVDAKLPLNVSALIDAGADADFRLPKDNTTPLFRAVYVNRPDIARRLLPHTRDLAAEARDDGGTALLWAAGLDDLELVRAMVEAGADAHAPGVLQSAAFAGRLSNLEYLVAHGVDVNARNRHGATALHVAAGRGRSDIVRWLLSRGANPALSCAQGLNPADWARQQQRDAVVELLADRH